MIPLPETFIGSRDQRGPAGRYHFKMLKRSGNVALFEKYNPQHKSPVSVLYEVVIIRQNPKRTFPDGRTVEAREAMPSPEEWGIAGWSPPDLESAEERFKQVVAAGPPDR